MRLVLMAVIAAFSFFNFAPRAEAGVLLEPYIGYTVSGEYETKIAGTTVDSDLKGVGYGLRLAWTSLGLMAGVDYSSHSLEDDDNEDIDLTVLGVFVGYEFPILLRIWAGYALKAETEIKETGLGTTGTYEGSGFKFGLGYTALPLISLNLEMYTGTIERTKSVLGIKPEFDFTTYMLSVSVPFGF